MKKLIVALLFLAGGITKSEAQSMLNVRMADNSPVNVAVDGRYFNKRGTSVTVGDLPPGKHRLQIYSVTRNRRGRGAEEVIYEGKVRTENGMVTMFLYDPNSQRPDIQEQDINTFAANHPPVQNGMAANSNGGNNGTNYSQDNGNNQGNQNYGNNGNNNNYTPSAPVPAGTLTDAKINQLKTDVAAKKTDTEKETLLKSGLTGEKITTDQVSMMMDWLSFESSKEEFAEWAWASTVDQQSFPNLENKFSFKNYQDALDKFIQGKQ